MGYMKQTHSLPISLETIINLYSTFNLKTLKK